MYSWFEENYKKMWLNMNFSLLYFPEPCPRCEEGTVWLNLQMHERCCTHKDKQLVPFLSPETTRTLVICFGKRNQISGLMCVQAREGSKGFWVTWRRVHRPGLSLWQRGLAWLRPALCQPIMSAWPDGRKKPLLKLMPSNSRITAPRKKKK